MKKISTIINKSIIYKTFAKNCNAKIHLQSYNPILKTIRIFINNAFRISINNTFRIFINNNIQL